MKFFAAAMVLMSFAMSFNASACAQRSNAQMVSSTNWNGLLPASSSSTSSSTAGTTASVKAVDGVRR